MTNGPSVWACSRAEWDAWAVVVDDDGAARPATAQEMLNRSVLVVQERGQAVIFHVGRTGAGIADFPGEPVAQGGPEVRERAVQAIRRTMGERPGGSGRGPGHTAAEGNPQHDDAAPSVRWAGERSAAGPAGRP